MVILPYAAQLIWLVIWVVPLGPTTRRWLSSLALVFQAWNCLDLFVLALSTLDHDLGPVTAYSADTACEPLVEVIPRFVGELLHPVSVPVQDRRRIVWSNFLALTHLHVHLHSIDECGVLSCREATVWKQLFLSEIKKGTGTCLLQQQHSGSP